MGILDDRDDKSAVLYRQAVLRASIQARATRDHLTYSEAVTRFAEEIDRAEATVYAWLSTDSVRPLPARHYERLLWAGLVDPTLVSTEQNPTDPD